jgi:hypothetical protein
MIDENEQRNLILKFLDLIHQTQISSGDVTESLPFGADYLAQSNPDGNGNYQTITYKTGGASGVTVKTITLTFDGSGNVLTYSEA